MRIRLNEDDLSAEEADLARRVVARIPPGRADTVDVYVFRGAPWPEAWIGLDGHRLPLRLRPDAEADVWARLGDVLSRLADLKRAAWLDALAARLA